MLNLNVNGKPHPMNVPSDMPLPWVLPDVIGLTNQIQLRHHPVRGLHGPSGFWQQAGVVTPSKVAGLRKWTK